MPLAQAALKPVKTKDKPEYMRPGISFLNPQYIRPATIVKDHPWLMMRWSTPFSVVRSGYPPNVWSNKTLNVRRGYWRRESKNGILLRLNHSGQEIDSFDDMGLGQTPDNENATPTHGRNLWGALTSFLTQSGGTWQRQESDTIQEKITGSQTEIDENRDRTINGTNDAVKFVIGAALFGLYIVSSAKAHVR